MDNINAKVQYLKGMADGINMLDGDKFLLVQEIINTLEVMAEESARISERMQKEIERLQSLELDVGNGFLHRNFSKHTNYDYFDDITAPFLFKNQPKAADVWYDESLNVRNVLSPQAIAPKENEDLKFERICKHCGSYVSCEVSADEVGNIRIQCPKCKRFLLPYDTNVLDAMPKNLDEQTDSPDTSSLSADFAGRLRSNLKTFNWELSEEVFHDDSLDDQCKLDNIIHDVKDQPFNPDEESYNSNLKDKHKERAHVEHETKQYVKHEMEDNRDGLQVQTEAADITKEVQHRDGDKEAIPERAQNKITWQIADKEQVYETESVQPETEERPLKYSWQKAEEKTDEPKFEERPVSHWQTSAERPLQSGYEERPVSNSWQYYDERPAQLRFDDRPVNQEWHMPEERQVQPRYEERPVNQEWHMPEERQVQPRYEERPVQPQVEDANHDWKLQKAKWEKPQMHDAEPMHDWQLNQAKWEKPITGEPELNHDWELHREKTFDTRTEEATFTPERQVQEEHVSALDAEHLNSAYELRPEEEILEPEAARPAGVKEECADNPKLQEEPEEERPDWADEAQTVEPKIEVQTEEVKEDQIPEAEFGTAEGEPVSMQEEITESKEEEEASFDWNADFELSIDKILSMDKREKTDAEGANGITDSLTRAAAATGTKFNDESFGKFKYSFDKEEDLDRQRNKAASNYKLDKKVLKNFSFLGYASELAKKNN